MPNPQLPPISPTQRKHEGRSVVAHISDLHFTASTDTREAPWQALLADLECSDADVLVVTGDLIDSSIGDSFWSTKGVKAALRKVYDYLVSELCPRIRIDANSALIVIPGNHDYRLKGLMKRKCQFDLFRTTFGNQFCHKTFPALRLCIFSFDSNASTKGVNFATGFVREEDLVSFTRTVECFSKDDPDLWLSCTRISLLHHHPMPIAATEHRAHITDSDEFLLLKNAGLFMNQMVRTGIDLVLHGHKHYPAFSRASFPIPEGQEHVMSVVAAGSVGKGEIRDRSYNLITIADTGEMLLERRTSVTATYERTVRADLRHYETAREVKWLRLAEKAGSKLRANKYTRHDRILARTGDDCMSERFVDATSFKVDPLTQWEQTLSSRSGFFGERSYECSKEGQQITWKWDDPPSVRPRRRGTTLFDPPLGKSPLTFNRKGTIFNAVHFNQRDRLDATEGKDAGESASARIKECYDNFVLHVSFPENRFPQKFQLHVVDQDERRDHREEEFASERLVEFDESRSIVLAISKPLPGYNYKLSWDLPKTETEEIALDAANEGMAQEIISRLVALANKKSPHHDKVQQCLSILHQEILEAEVFRSTTGDDRLEITLYCYDEAKSGLVCCAARGDYASDSKIWTWIIKPGRTIIGQAYRRRAAVSCVLLPTVRSGDAIFYEPTEDKDHHTVIFCVPLFYPIKKGRRVAVLSLASRSNTSGLLRLQSEEAARLALVEQVIVWYGVALMPALGLMPLLTSTPKRS